MAVNRESLSTEPLLSMESPSVLMKHRLGEPELVEDPGI